MLTEQQYVCWCRSLGFTQQTKELLDQIRAAPPARRVGGGRKNVTGRYPSRKMGVTIQFESHSNELAAVLEYENDPDCLEFYDQPQPRLPLEYQAKNGRRLRVLHTADFFVLRRHTAGWVECKTEPDLLSLAARSPARFQQASDGRWHCPPGEQYASQFGLRYELRSSRDINAVYRRNLEFLEDYRRCSTPTVSDRARQALFEIVCTHPGITLAALLHLAEPFGADDVYSLIATAQLYVDLRTAALVEPAGVQVFCNAESARARDALTQGPAPATCEALARTGSVTGVIQASAQRDTSVQERLASASPQHLQEANRRYEILRPHLAGERISGGLAPARTVYAWLRKYRMAEALYGNGFLGLLPRTHQSGNRTRKLPERTRALMGDFIENVYETVKQPSRVHVYGALVHACEAQGTPTPSYKTFTREIARRPQYQQTLSRKGPRAAYQHEPCYLVLEGHTPRHGDRPWHICHIDHTELDIELVCSRTGQNLGRPWYTLMTDAFSRRLLALFLTFDPPSYRSCMMVLRECIRRHGRFPQSLVVDGGKEFDSLYFDTLLARFECTKKTRPPAKARFGSVCERLFGTSNTQFIHNLAGNTQLTTQVRQVTKAVNPKLHAEWTLAGLYECLCTWAYEIYDTIPHPALGQSPREAFAAGLAQSGHRPHRMVVYDEAFRLWTLPTTARGTARVVPGKGVKMHHIFYWTPALRDPEVEQSQVPVRYDPYDAGTAYAYVHKRWVQCISEHYGTLHGKSEREIMLATAELRRRAQQHTAQFTVTAKKLAAFLASVEGERLLSTQRARDREAKDMLAIRHGAPIEPPCSHACGEAEAPKASSAQTLSIDELVVYEEY
jgi:transposase InsO family protein